MDWNLKTPNWDFTQFEEETLNPNIKLISGSSSSSSFDNQRMSGEFSVDLKLGQVVGLQKEPPINSKVPPTSTAPKMLVSPSGSSKRPRLANDGVQTVSCLADGCSADLSKCREYHRRHKVCELHSKAPQVSICGHKRRFCQQCSRFHSLEEFDDGKRSCRKRLDGHNRRRRKPQLETLSHSEGFLSNYQGSRLFSFSQVHPTTAVPNPVWSGLLKPEQSKLEKPIPFQGSSSTCYGGGANQFSFGESTTSLAFGNQAVVPEAVPRPKAIAPLAGGEVTCKMISGCSSTKALKSDCALSLLSSPPPTQTPGTSFSQLISPPNSIPLAEPLGLNSQYHNLEPIDPVLVSSNVCNTVIHCQGLFQLGPEAASDNGSPQTLPFYWE